MRVVRTQEQTMSVMSLPRIRVGLFLALTLVMGVTRFGHAGTAPMLPDASWAVFFIAGYYFANEWRRALPVLLIEAVLVDVVAIRAFGLSNYCMTLAYWFLVPAYASLWLGGSVLRHYSRGRRRDLALFPAMLVLSMSACFLLTNASYYWLSGDVPEASFAGWLQNMADWYPSMIGPSCAYVCGVAVLHGAITRWVRTSAAARTA
jgi:hypothetical protein